MFGTLCNKPHSKISKGNILSKKHYLQCASVCFDLGYYKYIFKACLRKKKFNASQFRVYKSKREHFSKTYSFSGCFDDSSKGRHL